MNEFFSVIITYYSEGRHDYVDEVYGTYSSEDKAYEVANKIQEKARFKVDQFLFGIDTNACDIYDVRVTMRVIDEEPFNERFFEGERE